MTLPGSYLFSILLLILSMLCWGSWANTFKATGKWRFELFYFDFAVGVFIAAVIAAFTFGTLGLDGFSVLDDIQLAGKKQDGLALVAGGVFNLANMLLVAHKASAHAPEVTVSTRRVSKGWDATPNPSGDAVLLEVLDTQPGTAMRLWIPAQQDSHQRK